MFSSIYSPLSFYTYLLIEWEYICLTQLDENQFNFYRHELDFLSNCIQQISQRAHSNYESSKKRQKNIFLLLFIKIKFPLLNLNRLRYKLHSV